VGVMIRSFPPHPNPLPPGERVGHSSPQQSWGVFWNILIKVETQKVTDITYKDKKVGVHRLDLIVEDKVVIELKTAERFSIHHKA